MTVPRVQDTVVSGKNVLVRVDFNVPIDDGRVESDFRIKKTLPTIALLQERGARVLLVSHLGGGDEKSLVNVHKELSRHLDAQFLTDFFSRETKEALSTLANGDVVLFENVRKEPGERSNNDTFARELASLAEVYVNEAFSASHRKHASIVSVPKYLPHYAGLLFQNELAHLLESIHPPQGSLMIIGGAKFETKERVIAKSLEKYEKIFVGGALVSDFLKAQGLEVGRSLVSYDTSGIRDFLNDPRVILPPDVVVTGRVTRTVPTTTIGHDEKVMDIGSRGAEELERLIQNAPFVLWNGPMGKFEDGFIEATKTIADALTKYTTPSVIGGGDTISALSELGSLDRFPFLSTAGGAMLQFLADGTLPGIETLTQKP